MFFVLHASLVFATPELALPRVGEALRSRRYERVVGEGPMWPSRRRSNGSIEAWTWPDLMIEHYHRFSGGRLEETHRFSPTGQPLSSVFYDSSGEFERVVIEDDTFLIGDWKTHRLGPFSLQLPPSTDPLNEWTGRLDVGHFSIQMNDFSTDPGAQSFTDELQVWCGCLLIDRSPVWLDGHFAMRFNMDFPHPTSAEHGELWVWSSSKGTLFVSYRTPIAESFAPGRALISTTRWTP